MTVQGQPKDNEYGHQWLGMASTNLIYWQQGRADHVRGDDPLGIRFPYWG